MNTHNLYNEIKHSKDEFRNLLNEDILLSNNGETPKFTNLSREHQFELGVKNKKTDATEAKCRLEFDEEDIYYKRCFGLESKEWKKNLWEIHPGQVKLSELAKTMRSVSVPGFTEVKCTQGIYGAVEGVDFNLTSSCPTERDEPIPENALVWVHYAMFVEGVNLPFDCSVKRKKGKPEILIASPAWIIPCLALAIRWLKAGQRGRFVFPPSAYSDLGIPDNVRPDTSVLLLLHAMRSLDAGAIRRYDGLDDLSKKDFNQVLYYVERAHVVAKDSFFRKKTFESIHIYKQSLEMLLTCERNISNNHKINELLLKTYVNLALSITKDSRSSVNQAIDYLDCAAQLKNYESNCKAHYLRGKCNMELMNYEEAQISLLKAFNLEPNNEEIGKELKKLENILKGSNTVQKKIAKKYANREDELDEKEVKAKERFVSNESLNRVKDYIKTLKRTHATVLADSWPLFEEEVNIVKDLFEKSCIES